jgi:hypothetical protein
MLRALSQHERKIVIPSAARDLLSADAPRSTATTDDLVVAQHAARSISARFLQIASASIISS